MYYLRPKFIFAMFVLFFLTSTLVRADEQVTYQATGKRDPFSSSLRRPVTANEAKLGPLEKFDLQQLKLIAVIAQISNPMAMIETPSGCGIAVRVGTPIGKNRGRVSDIGTNHIIIEEPYQQGKRRLLSKVRLEVSENKTKGKGQCGRGCSYHRTRQN
jgi:Tfp pilus assembly protein PilP